MVRVDQETKDFYKGYSGHKEFEIRIPELDITLTNEDIVAQSFSLTEAIENGENLTFTGCIASCFKFKCTDLVQDLKGQYIECDLKAEDLDTIPLFRGYIDSATNSSHEQVTMEIVAYDVLKRINDMDATTWYNSLSFPITCRNFRNSFFTMLGVEQVDDYLTNDGMYIYKSIEDKVIKGSKIIKAICEINGSYGRISRTGKFEYVHLVEGTEALYPKEDLYPADDIYPSAENALDTVTKAHYMSIEFENYTVAPIDKVQLVAKDGSICATAGTGNNIFTVENNPLIYGQNQSQLNATVTNLYNTIKGLWYTPTDVNCVGLPYVECGDFVMSATKRSIVRAYVLNRTLTGGQALRDNYSAEGDEQQPVYTPNEQTSINANAHAITREYNRASSAESGLQNGINGTNARVDTLNANLVQTNNLVAQKADISDLNATNANVNNLSANMANFQTATANSFSAVNARINTLSANMITSNTFTTGVNGVRISGGYVYCTALAVGSLSMGSGWFSSRAASGTYNVYRNGAVVGTVTI